jgi:hypothetical protein
MFQMKGQHKLPWEETETSILITTLGLRLRSHLNNYFGFSILECCSTSKTEFKGSV